MCHPTQREYLQRKKISAGSHFLSWCDLVYSHTLTTLFLLLLLSPSFPFSLPLPITSMRLSPLFHLLSRLPSTSSNLRLLSSTGKLLSSSLCPSHSPLVIILCTTRIKDGFSLLFNRVRQLHSMRFDSDKRRRFHSLFSRIVRPAVG